MRWRIPGCGVVVCAAALVAASIVAWGATVVPWQAAGSYDGETITVEGDVVRARLEADTCVLEFSTDDPNAFRAILLIPLITDLPRQPQRLYENKRVQVSGTIRTWHGRPEMIVRSPDAIEVVGVSASAPPPETTPTTTPAPTSRRRSPPTTLAPPPPPPPPPPPLPATGSAAVRAAHARSATPGAGGHRTCADRPAHDAPATATGARATRRARAASATASDHVDDDARAGGAGPAPARRDRSVRDRARALAARRGRRRVTSRRADAVSALGQLSLPRGGVGDGAGAQRAGVGGAAGRSGVPVTITRCRRHSPPPPSSSVSTKMSISSVPLLLF